MVKLIFTLIITVSCKCALAQDSVFVRSLVERLNSIREKSTNFDVLKFTRGHGWSNDDVSPHGYAPVFDFQFLWPYALFKDSKIHIAAGFAIGRSSISWKQTQWSKVNNELSASADQENNRSIQKTTYAGLRILPFIQIKNSLTIMAGQGIHFNVLGNKMKAKNDDGRKVFRTGKHVNKISAPVMLQMSYKINTLSVGLLGSYDLVSRFKNEKLKEINQISIGISGALIL